jgi:hypothetical protein
MSMGCKYSSSHLLNFVALMLGLLFEPEFAGSKYFRNIDILLQDYTAFYPTSVYSQL